VEYNFLGGPFNVISALSAVITYAITELIKLKIEEKKSKENFKTLTFNIDGSWWIVKYQLGKSYSMKNHIKEGYRVIFQHKPHGFKEYTELFVLGKDKRFKFHQDFLKYIYDNLPEDKKCNIIKVLRRHYYIRNKNIFSERALLWLDTDGCDSKVDVEYLCSLLSMEDKEYNTIRTLNALSK
jgi:hypothetical protein